MLITVLQAKIRKAVVTAADPEYKGSITIDEDILDEMGVYPYQVCDVNQNAKGGVRTRTYIIPGKRGTGCVECNGALAHHIKKGDIVHVNVYSQIWKQEYPIHKPVIIDTNVKE